MVNANSIEYNVTQIKNGMMKHVNMCKKVIVGILTRRFLRIASIYLMK